MITLYGGGPGFGLPELSPYSTKTEVQLQLAGLDYRKAKAAPPDSPKGQLPFIDDGGEVIADSTFIRAHIEEKYGVDLDAGLSARARAEAWAIERMVENQLIWIMAYSRWILPENFAKGPSHFFDGAPEAVRDQLRAEVMARVSTNLLAVGVTRHTPDEIWGLGERSLRALSDLLGDRPWLTGDQPSGVDATVFAALAGVITPFFDSPLRRRAERFPNLIAYVDRGMARWYPDFAWKAVEMRLTLA